MNFFNWKVFKMYEIINIKTNIDRSIIRKYISHIVEQILISNPNL